MDVNVHWELWGGGIALTTSFKSPYFIVFHLRGILLKEKGRGKGRRCLNGEGGHLSGSNLPLPKPNYLRQAEFNYTGDQG